MRLCSHRNLSLFDRFFFSSTSFSNINNMMQIRSFILERKDLIIESKGLISRWVRKDYSLHYIYCNNLPHRNRTSARSRVQIRHTKIHTVDLRDKTITRAHLWAIRTTSLAIMMRKERIEFTFLERKLESRVIDVLFSLENRIRNWCYQLLERRDLIIESKDLISRWVRKDYSLHYIYCNNSHHRQLWRNDFNSCT